jgi:hypothetical protein
MNLIIVSSNEWIKYQSSVLNSLFCLSQQEIINPVVISSYLDAEITPLNDDHDFYLLVSLSDIGRLPIEAISNKTLIINCENHSPEKIKKSLININKMIYLYETSLTQIALICEPQNVEDIFSFFPDTFYIQPNVRSNKEISKISSRLYLKARIIRYIGINGYILKFYALLRRIKLLIKKFA